MRTTIMVDYDDGAPDFYCDHCDQVYHIDDLILAADIVKIDCLKYKNALNLFCSECYEALTVGGGVCQ